MRSIITKCRSFTASQKQEREAEREKNCFLN